MNTIPSREIKRRGFAAVDEALKKGTVHVIKNNKPRYVVLSEDRYQELALAESEAYIARVKTALIDVKEARVQSFASVDDLLKAIDEEDK